MTIEQTLAEREDRYGAFVDHARLAQNLTEVMHGAAKWEDLRAIHREALEMIQHKIARILNGDPDYADNWHDIAGYATLVEQYLSTGFQMELAKFASLNAQAKALSAQARPTHWVCNHGLGINSPTPVRKVPLGEACPTCFATA